MSQSTSEEWKPELAAVLTRIPAEGEAWHEAWEMVKREYKAAQGRMARSLRPGARVRFAAKGKSFEGVIDKVNQKTVNVKVTKVDGVDVGFHPGYRVPPTILEVLA